MIFILAFILPLWYNISMPTRKFIYEITWDAKKQNQPDAIVVNYELPIEYTSDRNIDWLHNQVREILPFVQGFAVLDVVHYEVGVDTNIPDKYTCAVLPTLPTYNAVLNEDGDLENLNPYL